MAWIAFCTSSVPPACSPIIQPPPVTWPMRWRVESQPQQLQRVPATTAKPPPSRAPPQDPQSPFVLSSTLLKGGEPARMQSIYLAGQPGAAKNRAVVAKLGYFQAHPRANCPKRIFGHYLTGWLQQRIAAFRDAAPKNI